MEQNKFASGLSSKTLAKVLGLDANGNGVEMTPAEMSKAVAAAAGNVTTPDKSVTLPTVLGLDSSGNLVKAPLSDFVKELDVYMNYEEVEPVMIYFKRNEGSWTSTRFVTIDQWKAGNYASDAQVSMCGVVLFDGNTPLMIAPTGGGAMHWSNATGTAGTTMGFGKALLKSNDVEGEAQDAKIIASATYVNDCADSSVAVGFAHTYSTAGMAAGKWRLPAVGELLRMKAHWRSINKALLAIGGTEIPAQAHWSNTENSSTSAWHVYFNSNGHVNSSSKTTSSTCVRPVSTAF